MEDSPLHIVSSCVPTTDDRVDRVVNMLKDEVTPLLTTHHSAITNLSSIMGSASGGVPINQVVTDDESNGSTNTGSTTRSLAHYAINNITISWKNKDIWMAGRGN